MSDSVDKAKLMAFVHGELDEPEARAFTELMSRDEQVRLEVESLMQTSQALDSYYSVGTEEGFSPQQLARLRQAAGGQKKEPRSPWIFFTGGLVAAGLAGAVFFVTRPTPAPQPEMAKNEEVRMDQPAAAEAIGALAKEDSEKPGSAQARTRPEDLSAADDGQAPEAENAAQLALSDQAVSGAGAPVPMQADAAKDVSAGRGYGAGRVGGLQAKSEAELNKGAPAAPPPPPEKKVSAALAEPSADVSEELQVAEAAPPDHRQVNVVASKCSISPNLNKDKVLELIRAQVNGDETCVPYEVKLSRIVLIVDISKTGGIAAFSTEPRLPQSPAITQCFKTKLQDALEGVKPSGSAAARIKIPLELR